MLVLCRSLGGNLKAQATNGCTPLFCSMKRYIFLLLSFLVLTVANAEVTTNLIICAKDGTKTEYALTEKPVITFSKTNLIISTKSVNVSYPLDDFSHFAYESRNITSVEDVLGSSSFNFSGDKLLFTNLKIDTYLYLYNLDGALLISKHLVKNNNHAVSLSELQPGTYVVKVNKSAYKIIKR